jgi:periplasmic nitrate reductase NapE
LTDVSAQPPGQAAPATPQVNRGSEIHASEGQPRRRDELVVFLFVSIVLFPAVTLALMGTYGLFVWIRHMLGG